MNQQKVLPTYKHLPWNILDAASYGESDYTIQILDTFFKEKAADIYIADIDGHHNKFSWGMGNAILKKVAAEHGARVVPSTSKKDTESYTSHLIRKNNENVSKSVLHLPFATLREMLVAKG